MKGKILIVYWHDLGYPLRQVTIDALDCYEAYSDKLVFYLNAAFGIPEYLKSVEFDLIIYHMMILSKTSLPRRFVKVLKTCEPLKDFKAYKIAFPQDEYQHTVLLSQFMNDYNVGHIFSVSPSSELGLIYKDLKNPNVKFDRVLTAYLDDKTLERIEKVAKTVKNRDIDIGYRASYLRYALGRLGYLKYHIGEVFEKKAPEYDLITNISNRPKDTFLGLDWYKFLLRCKYTIGIEGGASLLDPEGKVAERVAKYLETHPNAPFDEVENNCFKGLDGKLHYNIFTPRSLEASATKTCQILVEGEYNGILKAGKHYIELKKDFSNIKEVLKTVKDDKLRSTITEQAFQDIIQSGKYTYRAFVQQVFQKSLGSEYKWSDISKEDKAIHRKNKSREKLIWKYIPIRSFAISSVLNLLPLSLFRKVEKYMKSTPK